MIDGLSKPDLCFERDIIKHQQCHFQWFIRSLFGEIFIHTLTV